MSCKSCGGKLPVEQGASQRIMLSNVLLEPSNVISPHLSWKTASNGRRRSSRRARTSFTQAKRKNSRTKNLKARKDHTDKDSKSRCKVAFESEKSVPAKKRRILLVHTPSSPHYPPLYSDSGLEEQSASYQDALLTAKQHSHGVSPVCESELVECSSFVLEKSDLEDVTAKNCDAADFSGKSILAAAVCDSNAGGEFMNDECSTFKQQFSVDQELPKENAKISTALEKEDPLPQISKDSFGRTDLPIKDSSSSATYSKKSNDVKSDGSGNLASFVNSFQKALNKTTSSSGNVKFHWDLNIAAEEWDSQEEVLGSDQEAATDGNACEDRVNGHAIFGQNAHQNVLVETDTENADKCNKKDTRQGEMAAVEVKMDNATFNLPNDDIDAARNDFHANTAPVISICNSAGNTPGNPDASPALRSREVCINSAGQVALENHLEHHYYSDAFSNIDDRANRMGKIKFVGDDGPQYEDGECREPLANCWIYDGAEEEENEQADYRSNVFEAAASYFSSDNKLKEVRKDTKSASQSSMNCPSSADEFDSTSSNAGDVTGLGFQEDLSAGEGFNDFGDDGRLVKGVGKMSGRDRLPDGCGISGKRKIGSINQNQNDASSFSPRACDSLNGVIGLSLKRDLSSRVERVRSSDTSQRKDYHGPASSSHLGSRNGFGIASDGMYGKSVGNISSQHAHRRSSARSRNKTESAFGTRSRRTSPDRPIFIGRDMPVGMDGAILREKYRGPSPDDIADASSSTRHTTHRRGRNLSPSRRRRLRAARFQSRSPSRPRTRSPHRWMSPSGRRDNVMNGSPCSRLCSRSPKFKPEAGIDSSRAGFGAPIVRSPPAGVLARGRGLDWMGSAGRFKPEEISYPMYSGRSPEFVGFGRRSVRDAKPDNRRNHDDGDEMPRSPIVSLSDDKNGFLAQNLRANISEYQRRVNSRDFDRRRERQIKRRRRKAHFRNGGDGEYNVNFKSYGVQDRYHDMDAQRKPL